MMCDECGIREAKFHLTTIKNDERSERRLCPVCMAKYQKQLPGLDFTDLAGIINNMLSNIRGSREEAQETEAWSELICEQCGTTYAEFRKSGMVGCANCNSAFREPLDSLLQRIHGNTQHTGRIPGAVRKGVSLRMNIDRLREQLNKAVAQEEYEQAAKLRDAIRTLTAQLNNADANGDIKVRPHQRLDSQFGEGGENHV